jgi:hypothetical protein
VGAPAVVKGLVTACFCGQIGLAERTVSERPISFSVFVESIRMSDTLLRANMCGNCLATQIAFSYSAICSPDPMFVGNCLIGRVFLKAGGPFAARTRSNKGD